MSRQQKIYVFDKYATKIYLYKRSLDWPTFHITTTTATKPARMTDLHSPTTTIQAQKIYIYEKKNETTKSKEITTWNSYNKSQTGWRACQARISQIQRYTKVS